MRSAWPNNLTPTGWIQEIKREWFRAVIFKHVLSWGLKQFLKVTWGSCWGRERGIVGVEPAKYFTPTAIREHVSFDFF